MNSLTAPFRVQVASVVSSRYGDASTSRPLSWDERKAGHDMVRTKCGRTLRLMSDGQQSVPQPGWTILVSGGDEISGFLWTLYGMPKGAVVHTY